MAEVKIATAAHGSEYKDEAANRLAIIFRDDPVITYMLSSLSPPARAAYITQYFHTLTKAAVLSGGIFQQAADWSCIAIWLPPNCRIDGTSTVLRAGFIPCILKLGLGGAKRMLFDFQAQADALKKRYLKDRGVTRFYYLFFIGTDEKARGQGLASKVIRAWQAKARAEGLPIWLEATTEGSKRVYERCGFGFCEEIVMGRGTHDGTGERRRGGDGVRMWGMVWWPERGEKGEGGEVETMNGS
ncbi:hypothetical protein PRZ48_008060 [Zasmidium cellare]|uniref:N-acetyltransferase domain-containing protein n=1 Tax=Zasmidium cellare TaxID=395010 RepID=A0ABR0EES6_ZASCE|nr:hypothetical protein PRZ48_008060 [Zasmidium cellare]